MQLVLVAGFNTKIAKTGPKVRIYEGRWRLVTENHIDCDIILCNESGHQIARKDQEFLSDGSVYRLHIEKPGTESSLTVFAEYIRDPKSAKST